MSVNFPNSPEDGDIFSGYIYDATKSVWKKLSDLSSSGIDDLNDVTITSPENGQALIYDTSIEEWINQTLVEPVLTLEGLSDTNIEDPLDGQALVYDSASGEWINETPASNLNDLSDVTISTATTDQLLRWSGTAWVNDTAKTNSIANGAVTEAKIASNAITTAKILDANVTTNKLANDSVTSDKISNNNVTSAKLTSGTVVQVVRNVFTGIYGNGAASWVASPITASITPTRSTSMILVICEYVAHAASFGGARNGATRVLRNNNLSFSSEIGDASGSRFRGTKPVYTGGAPEAGTIVWLDSPGTTSSTVYTLYSYLTAANGAMFFNHRWDDSNDNNQIRSVSSMTLMEIL